MGEREENDYYAPEPRAVELLLELESFATKIWEPACGEGHISKILAARGHQVLSTDLIDRGYGKGGVDFLSPPLESASAPDKWDGDIITNPPYKFAQEFVERALERIATGHKVAMFLKLTFLEGKARRSLFESQPPKRVWVASSRLQCGKNGVFFSSSATAYAWYIWEKGYKGDTVVKWFN